MRKPLQALSPRVWVLLVFLSSTFINLTVSTLVMVYQRQKLSVQGFSAEILSDLERSPLAQDPSWLLTNACAVQFTLLASAAFWLWFFGARSTLPFRRVNAAGWLGTFLLCLGALPMGSAIEELVRTGLGIEVTTGLLIVKLAHNSTPAELLLLMGAIALLPGITEELLFRGVMTRLLLPLSKLEALMTTSLLFGLAHIELAQAAGTFILGLAFGVCRVQTGSLLPPIFAHVLNNALVLSVAYASDLDPIETDASRLPFLIFGVASVALGAFLLFRQKTAE